MPQNSTVLQKLLDTLEYYGFWLN